MKQTMTLTNYLFTWFMKQYGKWIVIATAFIGFCMVFGYGMPKGSGQDMSFFPNAFRTYDQIVDYSMVEFVFAFGLLALLVCAFVQMVSFSTNGKGIYSLMLLPMKRQQVFLSFVWNLTTVVVMYFAVWFLMLFVLYFPLTALCENAAQDVVYHLQNGSTLTGMDATLNNGLYLAFQRSDFLSSAFPVSGLQAMRLVSGLSLVIVATVLGALYTDRLFTRLAMLAQVVLGFYVAGYRFIERSFGDIQEMPATFYLSGIALVLAVGVLVFGMVMMAKRRNV
ncbi:hypothetical protein [Chakrabartyella piscis]|uniref:hypothetical protein n=1 Tax=Chakrabartyella piscis TaxID=2918914 RepID=UPI0029583938|nr:hypothetical protein [Chakrabartyella piscis]